MFNSGQRAHVRQHCSTNWLQREERREVPHGDTRAIKKKISPRASRLAKLDIMRLLTPSSHLLPITFTTTLAYKNGSIKIELPLQFQIPLTRPPRSQLLRHIIQEPWPSAAPPTWTELLAQQSFPLSWSKEKLHTHLHARNLKVIDPDWGATALKARNLEKSNCLIGTWLGHASVHVSLPLCNTAEPEQRLHLLFDPIFSLRAGPTQWTGPRRFNDPPCAVSDLPGCDAIFISHNHYDHLDLSTIKSLLKSFPSAHYFVPLGNRSWLSSSGVSPDQIHELDWQAYREYSPEDFSIPTTTPSPSSTIIRFTCVPAQHNSGRIGADSNRTLWCGWVVEQLLTSTDESATSSFERHSAIYHAGDTGYRRTARSSAVCPVFKDLGETYRGFDLAFLPIWRGGTLGFISNLGLRLNHEDVPATFHASPKDAVDIHIDVRSRNSVGVHFGTFVGAASETMEAVIEFREACEGVGVRGLDAVDSEKEGEDGKGRGGVLDIGGVWLLT